MQPWHRFYSNSGTAAVAALPSAAPSAAAATVTAASVAAALSPYPLPLSSFRSWLFVVKVCNVNISGEFFFISANNKLVPKF